jgi:hypothetical protein
MGRKKNERKPQKLDRDALSAPEDLVSILLFRQMWEAIHGLKGCIGHRARRGWTAQRWMFRSKLHDSKDDAQLKGSRLEGDGRLKGGSSAQSFMTQKTMRSSKVHGSKGMDGSKVDAPLKAS